jgi:hypothetical protein
MTKAHSEVGDNGGRCEGCDDPKTVGESQSAFPVMLGGGLGEGTMWLCNECAEKRQPKGPAMKEMKFTVGHIDDAVDRLIGVAPAYVMFNGTRVEAFPGDTYEVVRQRYHEARQRLDEMHERLAKRSEAKSEAKSEEKGLVEKLSERVRLADQVLQLFDRHVAIEHVPGNVWARLAEYYDWYRGEEPIYPGGERHGERHEARMATLARNRLVSELVTKLPKVVLDELTARLTPEQVKNCEEVYERFQRQELERRRAEEPGPSCSNCGRTGEPLTGGFCEACTCLKCKVGHGTMNMWGWCPDCERKLEASV